MEDMRKMTAYLKTEALLTNYKKFKKGVQNKKLLIAEYNQEGLPKTSKSIIKYSSDGVCDSDSDFEKKEEIIESLKSNIRITELLINLIDKALEEIKYDQYYEIIVLKYFEDFTINDIALQIYCSGSAVSRNLNRLVRQLSSILFSDEVITELYGVQ